MLLAATLAVPVVLAQSAPPVSAQPAGGYREPVPELKAIVDAPRPPQLSLSPRRDLIALQQVPPLPSIALVAQPELRLAGLRINPRTYAPSRFSFASDLWLMDVNSGREIRIEGLPQPLSLASVSVSYTHLDVYKRQAFRCPSPSGGPAGRSAVRSPRRCRGPMMRVSSFPVSEVRCPPASRAGSRRRRTLGQRESWQAKASARKLWPCRSDVSRDPTRHEVAKLCIRDRVRCG